MPGVIDNQAGMTNCVVQLPKTAIYHPAPPSHSPSPPTMPIMSGIKRPPEYESPEPVPKTKARRTDPMTLEQALDRIAILENRLKRLDTPAVRLSVWLMESHIN